MKNNKTYKIILVGAQKIFQEGLKQILEIELGHTVIAETSNGTEFLELTNIHKADIVLMDIIMSEKNGLEASGKILNRFSNLKIIAITMYNDNVYLKDLLKRGIRGCIHKSNIFEELAEIIDMVYNGEFCFPDDLKG